MTNEEPEDLYVLYVLYSTENNGCLWNESYEIGNLPFNQESSIE